MELKITEYLASGNIRKHPAALHFHAQKMLCSRNGVSGIQPSRSAQETTQAEIQLSTFADSSFNSTLSNESLENYIAVRV